MTGETREEEVVIERGICTEKRGGVDSLSIKGAGQELLTVDTCEEERQEVSDFSVRHYFVCRQTSFRHNEKERPMFVSLFPDGGSSNICTKKSKSS